MNTNTVKFFLVERTCGNLPGFFIDDSEMSKELIVSVRESILVRKLNTG